MTTRSRTSSRLASQSTHNGSTSYKRVDQYMTEGPNGFVFHSKCHGSSYGDYPYLSPMANGQFVTLTGWHSEPPTSFSSLPITQSVFRPHVNWDSLPNSTDFNLLVALRELEETLDVFFVKFWKDLNGKGIEYGLKPLLTDLLELSSRLATYTSTDYGAIPITSKRTYDFDQACPPGAPGTAYKGSVVTRLSGFATSFDLQVLDTNFKEFAEFLSLLDAWGLHPDLGTLWDSVPLSFVIEWFIPVSALLSRIHPRGWTRQVGFNGWFSAKADFLYGRTGYTYGVRPFQHMTMYTRSRVSDIIPVRNFPPPVEFSSPSVFEAVKALDLVFGVTPGSIARAIRKAASGGSSLLSFGQLNKTQLVQDFIL